GKLQRFKELQRLLKSSRDQEPAPGRQIANEQFENRRVRRPTVQIGLHHVDLVQSVSSALERSVIDISSILQPLSQDIRDGQWQVADAPLAGQAPEPAIIVDFSKPIHPRFTMFLR